MTQPDDKALLVRELFERIERDLPRAAWRTVYVDQSETVRVRGTNVSVVCFELPAPGTVSRDGLLARISAQAIAHDGRVDPCIGQFALVSFSRASAALRMALGLQRLVREGRPRVGIASGRCPVALFQAAGKDYSLLLGSGRTRAEELARRAAGASVQLCPETFRRLEAGQEQELDSCLMLSEYDDDVLTQVSLTLPPDHPEELSTFAGLGLT